MKVSIVDRFKYLFNANRIESDRNEELCILEGKLSDALSRPTFSEVSKDFDASILFDEVIERLCDDLHPMLSEAATKFLYSAFSSPQLKRYAPLMTAEIAYCDDMEYYKGRFSIPPMRCDVIISGPIRNHVDLKGRRNDK